ncbi:MAG: hypothetical protein HOF89_02680 [Candidatus Nitrosopelagicus sp.]|nr:hypothetical protein [Candidatus Nitrosopelagicus sp.]
MKDRWSLSKGNLRYKGIALTPIEVKFAVALYMQQIKEDIDLSEWIEFIDTQ